MEMQRFDLSDCILIREMIFIRFILTLLRILFFELFKPLLLGDFLPYFFRHGFPINIVTI